MIRKEQENRLKNEDEAAVEKQHDLEEEEELLGKEVDNSDEMSPEEELKDLLEAKEKEAAENYDRLLRTQAEFENYKKRMEREKADTIKFCNEEIVRELLPVIDNLEMALEHGQNSHNSKSLVEGVEMVLNELLKSMEKFGVTSFSSVGEPFDANCHEAMMQIETDEYDENSVVSEFQKGYYLNERLLRPAKVTVSKLPGKPEKDDNGVNQ